MFRSSLRFRRPWPFLALALAASGALNIAFTGIIARHADASTAQAILTAAGAASTVTALFLTAVSADH